MTTKTPAYTEEQVAEQRRRYIDCYEAYKANPTNANYNGMNSQKLALDYMVKNSEASHD